MAGSIFHAFNNTSILPSIVHKLGTKNMFDKHNEEFSSLEHWFYESISLKVVLYELLDFMLKENVIYTFKNLCVIFSIYEPLEKT